MTPVLWLGRYAARVAVRRVVTTAVLVLLAWVGIGSAQAQATMDRGEAYAYCMDWAQNSRPGKTVRCQTSAEPGKDGVWRGSEYIEYLDVWQSISGVTVPFVACRAGTEWSDATKRCRPPCDQMNGEPGFSNPGQTTRSFTSTCLDGCTFAAEPNTLTTVGTGEFAWHTGVYRFTGQACDAPPPPNEDERKGDDGPTEQCSSVAGSDMTLCVRNDGSHCLSAGANAQICWKPGETGQKAQDNYAQVSNAGNTPIPPPNMNLPNGDALEPEGPSVPVQTTTNNTTINTTIQNYKTVNGTNPGGSDGTPKPGSPDYKPPGPNGPDEGDSEDGSASGGEDCDNAPIVSDPMLGMIATQAWATRCAVRAGNSAKVTGDVGDCKTEFTVEGDHAAAQQLRAMRAAICGAEEREEYAKEGRESDARTLDAQADDLEAEFGTNVFADEGGDGAGISFNTGWWSAGAGQCPTLSVSLPSWAGGRTWGLPPEFCQAGAWLSLLFQAIAMVWGIRIVMGK